MPSIVPKRITIPATVEEAVTTLNGLEALLTAKEWQRAAIVAAFIKPGIRKATGRFLTTTQFRNLGITGLRTTDTVALYAQRWLDAHDGIHPEPGAQVALPDIEWPKTRTGTDGYDSEQGAIDTLTKIAEKHPDALTKAAEQSDVVAEFAADAAEQAAPVRTKVVKRATKRNKEHKERIKEKSKPLQDVADEAKDAYDESDTGYTDPTPQTLARLIRDVHEAEVVWALAGGKSDGDTVSAISELQSAIDSWRQRMIGTGPVEITDNDRAWADELGIDLAS